MNRQKKIIIGGAVLAVALVIVGWWQAGFTENQRLFKKIQAQPQLVELFEKAVKIENSIKKQPGKASSYFDLGLAWKGVAELGGGEPFFEKSLEAYERGIKKFGKQNILFYLNAGKLAERLEDSAKAERYYKKAIEISPVDESGYLYLADLYSYVMKKVKEDVLGVYLDGLKNQANSTLIVSARASYLRRIGDYRAALVDYKFLKENGGGERYNEIIQELEGLIKG